MLRPCLLISGSQVRALVRPPPSPWVGALAGIVAVVALGCGLWLARPVSTEISAKHKGAICTLVSAAEMPVPGAIGDWFDDCVLGSQILGFGTSASAISG